MILDLIVGVVVALLRAVLALIPPLTIPDLGGFGGTLGTLTGAGNNYFPLTTLGACIAAVVLVRIFILAFDGVVFVYKLIPFKAT